MIGVLFDLLQTSWFLDFALQHEPLLNEGQKYLL